MEKTIFNAMVSYQNSIFDKKTEEMPLFELLIGDRFREKVEAVRNEKDPAKQQKLKNELPCFTPSGIFAPCIKADNLKEHSGFMSIDVDEKENTHVADFHQLKEKIHEIPYVSYCGLSARGKGYLIIIPIKDTSKHKSYFKALQRDFKNCGLNIDLSCSDVCRKRFVSYDPCPYIYTHAEVYDYTIPEYDDAVKHVSTMSDEDTRKKVEELLCILDRDKIDITESRQAWFEILCSLANQFGEEGREYAHRVSQHYDGYSYEETDNKFSEVLNYGYDFTIATLFYYANQILNSAEYVFKDLVVNDDNDL